MFFISLSILPQCSQENDVLYGFEVVPAVSCLSSISAAQSFNARMRLFPFFTISLKNSSNITMQCLTAWWSFEEIKKLRTPLSNIPHLGKCRYVNSILKTKFSLEIVLCLASLSNNKIFNYSSINNHTFNFGKYFGQSSLSCLKFISHH